VIRPGLLALLLIFLLALSLGLAPLHSHKILEDAYSQVVVIACQNGYGTGWFINHNYIVTAAHVVAGCSKPRALRGAWNSNLTVAAINTTIDVAVLKVADPPSWAKGLPLSYSVAIGDSVYVVGYPIQLYQQENGDAVKMSEIPRVAQATVAWIDPSRPYFSFTPGTDAGNSGGPIVSKESGGVVGIVVYARTGIVNNEFYGLRMDALASFLSQHHVDYHVAGGPGRAWLLGGLGLVAFLIVLELRGGKRVPRY